MKITPSFQDVKMESKSRLQPLILKTIALVMQSSFNIHNIKSFSELKLKHMLLKLKDQSLTMIKFKVYEIRKV